jgi:hypothetical protein
MATYSRNNVVAPFGGSMPSGSVQTSEFNVYGSSRLGLMDYQAVILSY